MAAKYTFTRNSVAYKSDGTPVAANQPRFEAGKFSKAVMAEEGTMNLILVNPKMNTDSNLDGLADGWIKSSTAEGYTLICSIEENSQKVNVINDETHKGYTLGVVAPSYSASEGQIFSASVDAKWTYGCRVYLYIQFRNSSLVTIGNYVAVFGKDEQNAFVRLKNENIVAPSGTAYIRMLCYITQLEYSTNISCWFKNAQLEQKPYATSFIDGTRSPETLTVPSAGVLNPQEGTVECWVNISANTSDTQIIFDSRNIALSSPNAYNIVLYMPKYTDSNARKLGIQCGDGTNIYNAYDSVQLVLNTWYYLALRWTANKLELLKNGQIVATINANIAWNLPSQTAIGCRTSLTGQLNGLIDDLRISNRARTDAEILAAYQSGQALAVDESTTLKLNFDPFDNADILVYNNGLVLPFNMQSSRDTKWQLIAPTRDATEEKEAADGDIDFGTMLQNGEIELHGIIEYASIQEKNTKKSALAGQLNDCRNKKLLALESNPDVGTYIRLKGRPEVTEYPSWMDVTIPFSADPFWQSIDEHYQQGSGTLTNAGTFEAPLIVEITGAVTNPSVVVGGQTLSYTGIVPAGQTLVIDTGNQTVKLNGVNALANYNGVFPMLQPGDTNVTAPSAGTTVFKWRDRWI